MADEDFAVVSDTAGAMYRKSAKLIIIVSVPLNLNSAFAYKNPYSTRYK